MQRRDLIRAGAGLVAALHPQSIERVRAADKHVNGRTPELLAADEDYWAEVRAAFTVDRNIINLNRRRQPLAAHRPGGHAPLPGDQQHGAGPHHPRLTASLQAAIDWGCLYIVLWQVFDAPRAGGEQYGFGLIDLRGHRPRDRRRQRAGRFARSRIRLRFTKGQ